MKSLIVFGISVICPIRGGSRNLGRGGHRKGVGAGGGRARGSFEQYSNTDTHIHNEKLALIT